MKEELNRLYKENGLTKDDTFILKVGGRQIPIILRSGIEKIQYKNDMQVSFTAEKLELDFVVVKAMGTSEGKRIETFGEASTKNTKNAYIVAMAEKRALSRVVLKLAGMYQHGAFGEDELTETGKFEYDVDYLERLLNNSSLKEDPQAILDIQNVQDMQEYFLLEQRLKNNALSMRDGNVNYSQTDIKKELKEVVK
jgi:hypothetical protein